MVGTPRGPSAAAEGDGDARTVTVASLDGKCVFGPERMPGSLLVRELRSRALAPTYALGDAVEVAEAGGDWCEGTVTSLSPLEVRAESARRGRRWDRVRPQGASAKPCYVTLCLGTRVLHDYQCIRELEACDGFLQVSAVYSHMTLERQQSCKKALARLRYEAQERVQSCDEEDIDRDEEAAWLHEELTGLFQRLGEEASANPEVMVEALVGFGSDALEFVEDGLRSHHGFLLLAVQRGQGNLVLPSVPSDVRSDRGLMLEVVRHDGNLLQWACQALAQDPDIVLEALAQNAYVFQLDCIPESLKSNRAFALRAVGRNGDVLQHLSQSFRDDEDIVRAACQQDVRALQHAHPKLLAREAFVLQLAEGNGEVLRFAAANLKGDKRVVLKAVAQCGQALRHASAGLRMDKEVVLAAVLQDPRALPYAEAGLHADGDIRAALAASSS